jgi:hypothetical protein
VLPNGDRVSVNSINASKNAQFLVDNSNGLWLEYDGFSKELVSKIRVIPGQTYHIKLAIADAGDAYYDSGVFIKTGGLTAVPIKLLSLKGRKSGYHNYIEWSSASESNSSQIEVLRSSDGKNFSPIGKVKGSGNSQTRTDYLFKDPKPLYGINYYRIKQIDFNGNHTFSEIISVSNYYADLHVSPVFPNPSTDILNAMVILPEASAIEAEITDLTGKSYLKKTFRVEEGTNIISLETADLPSGVYLVRIFNEDFPGSYQRITR